MKFLRKLFPEEEEPMNYSIMTTSHPGETDIVFIEAGWVDVSDLQKRFDVIIEQEIEKRKAEKKP